MNAWFLRKICLRFPTEDVNILTALRIVNVSKSGKISQMRLATRTLPGCLQIVRHLESSAALTERKFSSSSQYLDFCTPKF